LNFYYKVFPLSKSNKLLTYSYNSKIELLTYVEIPLGQNIVKGLVIKEVKDRKFDFDPKKLRSINRVLDSYLPLPYYRSAVFIKNYYFKSLSVALNLFKPFIPNYGTSKTISSSKDINLSSEQNQALNELKTSSPSLLFGDTGSGKTHIYLKLIDETLSRGEDVVFLVPEINLVPQTLSRVESHFEDVVAPWHSKVRDRKGILQGIYNRDIRVVVGTLSSLFLPFQKLGLIIVDEEHSSSYTLSGGLNFNGREMAIYLGRELNIQVILGSATPSINSYHKFKSIRLRGKFHKNSQMVRFMEFQETIPDSVLDEIEDRLEKKEQVIIFVPIRGNFKSLKCVSCGDEVSCPNCSVKTTLYSSEKIIRCNRCGYESSSNISCNSCGSIEIRSSREGTIEVAKKLQILFPDASIQSFDSDSSRKVGVETILEKFRNREIDILVGTQMISKGHDYPDVTLSIILGIDNSLNMGDFQAYEKSLSLLIQIAGRSGRKKESLTIIQTRHFDFFSKYIADYEKFLINEMSVREGMYPPFISFIKIEIKHSNRDRAEEILDHIHLYFNIFAPFNVFIAGASPIEKIEKKYRFQLVIKAKNLKESLTFIKESLELFPQSFGKYINIEINPNEYL